MNYQGVFFLHSSRARCADHMRYKVLLSLNDSKFFWAWAKNITQDFWKTSFAPLIFDFQRKSWSVCGPLRCQKLHAEFSSRFVPPIYSSWRVCLKLNSELSKFRKLILKIFLVGWNSSTCTNRTGLRSYLV